MALEPINVVTHSREIEQEYLKVVRGNDPDTTWLIISPNEKKEYAPQYVGSGFSEFLGSFDDVKVQYGLARVSPPGSDVEKLVLVGWCPDSAPMRTRASFASNFSTVANQVFRGYHIQVTARDTDDLDENELLGRVSSAAGARYSIQSASTGTSTAPKTAGSSRLATPSPAPSVGVPKGAGAPPVAPSKPSPGPTPAAKPADNDNDDEWGEPEVKERDLEKEPIKTNQSSYKPVGKVDLQKIIAEESSREDPRLVSNVSVEGKKAPDAGLGSSNPASSHKPDAKPKGTATGTGGVLGTKPPINFGASQSRDDDKVIKGFKNEKSPAQIWAEKKAAQNGGNPPAPAPAPPAPTPTATSSAPQPAAAPEPITKPEPEQPAPGSTNAENEQEPEVKDLKSRFEQLSASNEPPIIQPKAPVNNKSLNETEPKPEVPLPSAKKQFGTPLPGMHTEDDNEDNNEDNAGADDDDWDDGEPEAPKLPSRTPETVSSPPQPPAQEPDAQAQQENEPQEEDDDRGSAAPPLPSRTYNQEPPAPSLPSRKQEEEREESPAPPLPNRTAAQAEDQPPALPARNYSLQNNGSADEHAPPPPALPARHAEDENQNDQNGNTASNPSAIAEYDYEAAEDNELTFRENDKIVNIEFVDEDWWLGELDGTGEKGLFPSNYVSLQN
ncbi:hypothetical protein ZYGR_0AK07480 [Zygosaccharomyces rouxii]|uniref:Actin-binding protein n=1 Tax=Zygosaccharomyces rouxii TaxID=4956 RepID=A0A1Q3AEQ3_ZYGRO|nr:hypothetical protein ZYGR_0AK07480 [Zygosaccharomyces rouxii]